LAKEGKMIFERRLRPLAKYSTVITIPPDLIKYLGLKPLDIINIKGEMGKYGPFISIWKKDNKEA